MMTASTPTALIVCLCYEPILQRASSHNYVMMMTVDDNDIHFKNR